MKILVIPDIHEKIDKTTEILKNYENKVDRIIFLGDYFDSFDQPLSKCEETLDFILANKTNKKIDFLYGNHDLHYIYKHRWLKCSGFEYEKYNLIYPYREELKLILEPIIQIENYIFTHAGVHGKLIPPHVDVYDYVFEKASHALSTGIENPILGVSYMRGGSNAVGGITWCDWSEFEPLRDFTQIFGHTCKKTVRTLVNNYCIDTDLNHILLLDLEKNKIQIEGV